MKSTGNLNLGYEKFKALGEPDVSFGTIKVKPIIDYGVRKLCILPYPDHKKGCPNFATGRTGCPPNAPYFDKYFDLSKQVYALYYKFNLKEHCDKLKKKHPNWSDRQLRSVLYWQPKARKALGNYVKEFLKNNPNYEVVAPEGYGVDVIKTMANEGIKLIFPPWPYTYLIVFAGVKQ